jgi:hypothetical protein
MSGEVAVAKFIPEDSKSKLDYAKLWYVNGRPFSIEFAGSGDWNDKTIWRCELLYNFT